MLAVDLVMRQCQSQNNTKQDQASKIMLNENANAEWPR
jgi:hypothetical protein